MSIRKNFVAGWLLVVLVTLLVSNVVPSFAQDVQPASTTASHLIWQLPADSSTYKETPFAPGEILVGFHRDQARASALLTSMDVQFVEALDLRGLDGTTGDAGIDGQLLRVPEGREWEAINQLLADPAIAFALPNWLVQAADLDKTAVVPQTETPFGVNDPLYAERQWYLQRINASRAWSLAYGADGFGGQLTTIRVAIVDSGIDIVHPEFKGRILDGYNYLTSGTTKPIDDYGHGTHVAGLIGAALNNAVGIASLGTKVEFAPYKVLNSSGSGTIANVAAAIQKAADNKARIINMSLETSSPNPVMEAAVKYAYNKGVLLIAAAGNSYPSPVAWPAAYSEVMAVAATNYTDRHASYSNVGTQVAIAAPGGESSNSILSTWPGGIYCRDIKAKLPQSGYCTSEGTSMAAAVVSGAAALVMSVHPELTADQVRQLLINTATPLSEDASRVGSGRLDIDTALHQLLPTMLNVLAPNNVTRNLSAGAAPYTVTVRIENPSLNAITWHAKLDQAYNWVSIQDAITGTITGTARYGEPAPISLTITPTNLFTGSYVANLQVIGTRADQSPVTQTVGVSLFVGAKPLLYFFPMIFQGVRSANSVSYNGYNWEAPAKVTDRTTYNMADSSEVDVTLPTTITLRGQAYTNVTVFSDGYVSFPGGSSTALGANVCLPQVDQVQRAIYGWWADLNPSALGARVSTFPVGSDRFVIEYENVPTAIGVTPAYTVSFQIVLYTNGDVRLNYQQTPDLQTAPPHVTVGLEASDGRFHNQVACKDDKMEFGILPGVNQSILFDTQGDIY
ncbi:MAG: S8 family serine peptidase [Chloroflexi bacterium]|nr:S8 family serine peptidase [Chloroflexota bacterium]